MKNVQQEMAAKLLEVGAVKLNVTTPFRWASGWLSPIYCDNRLTLSFPAVRTFIKASLQDLIEANFPDVEAIAGVATAGIPQASLLADTMNLPLSYVRSKPKGHGMKNLIEGQVQQGQHVVVVEDLVSTGGSSIAAVKALREAGAHVLGMIAIFTYGFDIAQKNLQGADLQLVTLSDYPSLLQEAVDKSYIESKDMPSLEAWRKNPQAWKGL